MNAHAIHITPATNCLVIGLGKTGLSCAKFLVQQGIDVVVMDTREMPPFLTELQRDLPEVVVKTGGLDRTWLQQADMIVLSPGVDPRLPEIAAAKQAGVELIGDIELFSRYANAPIVAITGSNGKSTVTTLLADMAEAAGKNCKVGGNLGIPALDLITDPAPDFYIIELSSFQLETVQSLNAFVSVVLNVSPDHLDRYDSVQDYQYAKSRIFAGNGVMIINRDDVFVQQLAQENRNQIGFSLHINSDRDFGVITQGDKQWLAAGQHPLMAVDELKIFGKHNIANALAALALGSAMALPMPAMLLALQHYRGLPHRCRLITDINRICWFNDSKATNVGACIAAIEGLADSGKVVLIAGGDAKGQDFSELTPVLDNYVRAVVLIGQDAQLISGCVPETVETHFANTLRDAVDQAQSVAQSGDNVLLSPACASFNMFSDYIERGELFESLVKVCVS